MALPLLAIPALITAAAGVASAAAQSTTSYFNNRNNLALSREALEAQKAQQSWANARYLEDRDYTRSLQQTIFEREDTALQRAKEDAVNAGFSPLTAVGNALGAGQVVSTPSAPSAMVSNNQASLSTPDFSSIGSAGAMIATMFENQTKREFEHNENLIKMAHDAEEAGLGRLHEQIMKTVEHDFLKSQENQKHYNRLQELLTQGDIQKELANLQHSNTMELEGSKQEWQAVLQEDSQAFQRQQATDSRIGTSQRAELIDKFIGIVAEGDSKLAKWLKQNSEIVTTTLQLLSTFAPTN